MTTEYTINLENKSEEIETFMLFGSPPQPNSDPDISVYSNVFITTPKIHPPNGSYEIILYKDLYAVCGTALSALSTGVLVASDDYQPVTLTNTSGPGTVVQLNAPFDSTPYLEIVQNPDTPPLNGNFKITTGDDIEQMDPRNIFIGIGGMGGDGTVVPLSIFQPDPNAEYHITPVVTYFTDTGSYKPGVIIDVTETGRYGTIDFTGIPQTTATASFDSHGDWTVKYEA